MPVTERQLEANRQNAQLSTGPKTAVGKAIASQNAVKTGLTGRAILLQAGEADWYEQHVARFRRDFSPLGERELELVQSLADTQWRLNRIPILEAGLYAIGRIQYEDLFADQAPELQPLLIENHIFRTHARELNNLSIQESRLRRNYAKDLAELKALQTERQAQTQAQEQPSVPAQPQQRVTAAAPADGFEFSTVLAHSSESARSLHPQASETLSAAAPYQTRQP
jgi:hypothetical protein